MGVSFVDLEAASVCMTFSFGTSVYYGKETIYVLGTGRGSYVG